MREPLQFFEVFPLRSARAEAFQNVEHPPGADAAEGALAARLLLRELEKIAGHVHHARCIIQYYQPAGTHDRAHAAERFVIDARVRQPRRDAAARGAADLHRLERAPLGHAAADLLDDLAQRRPHRHLDQPAAPDMPCQREDLGALALGRADGGELLRAVAEDPRHQRQGFDVVDERRAAPQARNGGERRAQLRHAALAFNGGDEGGLLAADKRARAFHDGEGQFVIRARQLPAKPAARFKLRNGGAHPLHGQRVFVADVENALVRPGGNGGNRQAFDHAERERFEDHAIHERAGVALVAVADHEFFCARLLLDNAPFDTAGESRAAAPTQAGLLDAVDDLLGLKFAQHAAQRGEPAAREIFVQVKRIDRAEMFGGDVHLPPEKGVHLRVTRAHGVALHVRLRFHEQRVERARPKARGAMENAPRREMAADKRGSFRRGQIGVIGARFAGSDHLDHRRAVADAHAADALYLDRDGRVPDCVAQGVKEAVAPLGDAARAESDVDGGLLCSVSGLCGKLGRGRRGGCEPVFLIRLHHLRNGFRACMPERRLVDFDHRRERATAEAGDRLHGEFAPGVGVVAFRDVQVPPQRVLHARRAGDMAGRAPADAHHRFAHRLVPEHVVERGDTFEGRGRDLRRLANTFEGLLRQVAVMILHGLENRDQRLGAAPDARHRLINKWKIKIGHG